MLVSAVEAEPAKMIGLFFSAAIFCMAMAAAESVDSMITSTLSTSSHSRALEAAMSTLFW
ncbi:hypothetical protein D3C86_2258630 [compost metagenome]